MFPGYLRSCLLLANQGTDTQTYKHDSLHRLANANANVSVRGTALIDVINRRDVVLEVRGQLI